MIMLFQAFDGIGGNGAKAFQCAACGGPVTRSDRLLPLGGKNRHLYTNPAGAECDFYTFHSCPGAIAPGEATEEYTWFPGYAWVLTEKICRRS